MCDPADTTEQAGDGAVVNAPPPSTRFDGFDALRGGAMLLGILLHAAITYMVRPMSGLLWPLSNEPKSYGFDLLFWWIHGWRIPLFFVMAGFFAAMLARRRGAGGFIKHRFDRIIKPVAVASITILPVMFYLWAWGWWIEGRVSYQEILDVKFKQDPEIQKAFIGPAHLWFLYYLAIYSLVYWAVLRLRGDRVGDDQPALSKPTRWLMTSPLRPVWFALPTFGFLAVTLDFYLGYHHVVPRSLAAASYEVAQLLYQGWFFLVGIYLFRMHREMEVFKRYAWLYIVLGTLMFVVVAGLKWAIEAAESSDGATRLAYVIHAASIALFCWLMIWGLTGLGLTVLAKPRYVIRWLSDSAYWVYLTHLPIVALLLIVMRDWLVGPWVKFTLIVAITSAATLLSYRYGVRYTFVGRFLNGPRTRPVN